MELKIETKAIGEAMLLSVKAKANGDNGGADFASLLKHAETRQSDAAAELEKYVKMTPAQRMAAAIMKSLGITQEQFDAMSPDQQAAVTAQIAAIMKQQMQDQMAGNQQDKATTAL